MAEFEPFRDSRAPVAAFLIVGCAHKNHASHSEKKAAFVDAHASSVFVDDDSETSDETVVIESTPDAIPRMPAPAPRTPVSFTRG